MDVKPYLARSSIFGELGAAALESLAGCSRVREVPKGEHLFLEGDEGDEMYILARGSVRLYKSTADGRETTVRMIGPLGEFAEVVFPGGGAYPVSAVAAAWSTAIAVSGRAFRSLLDVPDFRDEFIALLFRKMRYLSERLHRLSVYDVEQRLLLFLREQGGGEEEFELEMPKKDIASAIGTVPETLSRLLQKMKERGDMTWKGKTIRLRAGFWEDPPSELP